MSMNRQQSYNGGNLRAGAGTDALAQFQASLRPQGGGGGNQFPAIPGLEEQTMSADEQAAADQYALELSAQNKTQVQIMNQIRDIQMAIKDNERRYLEAEIRGDFEVSDKYYNETIRLEEQLERTNDALTQSELMYTVINKATSSVKNEDGIYMGSILARIQEELGEHYGKIGKQTALTGDATSAALKTAISEGMLDKTGKIPGLIAMEVATAWAAENGHNKESYENVLKEVHNFSNAYIQLGLGYSNEMNPKDKNARHWGGVAQAGRPQPEKMSEVQLQALANSIANLKGYGFEDTHLSGILNTMTETALEVKNKRSEQVTQAGASQDPQAPGTLDSETVMGFASNNFVRAMQSAKVGMSQVNMYLSDKGMEFSKVNTELNKIHEKTVENLLVKLKMTGYDKDNPEFRDAMTLLPLHIQRAVQDGISRGMDDMYTQVGPVSGDDFSREEFTRGLMDIGKEKMDLKQEVEDIETALGRLPDQEDREKAQGQFTLKSQQNDDIFGLESELVDLSGDLATNNLRTPGNG